MSGLKIALDFELPLDLVTEATAIVATRGAGKSSLGAVLVEETMGQGVPVCVLDYTGVFHGLRSNAKGNGPGLPIYVFGGEHPDLPLEASAGRLIADLVAAQPHSFVLDLSNFTKNEMRRFCADFLERLYDQKAKSRSTLLLVVDEAHELAPQSPRGGFKGDGARLISAMERVAALGRSRGIGIVLITQRTQALNKAVLDLIETLFVMRMLSPRARLAVKDWIMEKHEDDEHGVLATLKGLPTGTAWVWSPLRDILKKIKVRRIETFNSYATPKPGEVTVEAKVRATLDLAALGEQMAATVEKAKENDPAELHRQIAQLRGELARAVGTVKVETHEVKVEVPVEVPISILSENDRELLEEIESTMRTSRELVEALVVQISGKVEAAPSFLERVEPPRPPDPVPSPIGLKHEPGFFSIATPKEGLQVTNGEVTVPEQRVLDALAWYERFGIPHPERVQVAVVAKYKVSGNFNNILSKLNTAGRISYPEPGRIALTDDGRQHARQPDLPLSGGAMRNALIERLPGPQAKVLNVLVMPSAYPVGLLRTELAEMTGYQVSGNFNNILSSLKTMGLIEYPAPGVVRAKDILFPGGS